MKKVKYLLLDPAVGRYEPGEIDAEGGPEIEREIARILSARHVVALVIPPEEANEPVLVAWTDMEARKKVQTCCWVRSASELAVPGRALLTGMIDDEPADVPFADTVIDGRITTYVAQIQFPRPGPTPVFETEPTPVLTRTYNG